MVEEHYSLDTWEHLIEQTILASEGIYTSSKTYPDEEIVLLITALAKYSGEVTSELIEKFGHYLFPHLMHSLPAKINHYSNLWDFLAAVDGIIHVEVKKLSPDALTPDIKIISFNKNNMKLSYSSSRKLCFLAIGLIEQAGEYYNSSVVVSHQQCMHDGHTQCILEILSREDNA